MLKDLQIKWNNLDISGKLIAVLVLTSIFGWILAKTAPLVFFRLELPLHIGFWGEQPWSLLTYAFLHTGLFHLLGNVIGVFYTGRMFLNLFNGKHFMTLFILGVIAGALVLGFAVYLLPSFFSKTHVIGASGGVFALICFVCGYFADRELRIFNFGFALKYVGYVLVGFNVLSLANPSLAAGALIHLVGAALGYIAAVKAKDGELITAPFVSWYDAAFSAKAKTTKTTSTKTKRSSTRMKTVYKNKNTPKSHGIPNEEEVNIILEKVHKNGYESLSKKEKEILFKASQQD